MAQTDPTDPTAGPPSEPVVSKGLHRGAFVWAGTLGLGGLVGAMIVVPVTGFAIAPAFQGQKSMSVDIGAIADFPEGKFVKAVVKPDASNPDGYVEEAVAYVRKNADGFTSPLTGMAEDFTIISNRCAHLGCPVQNAGAAFVCPCHGGAYDSEGKRVAGPPVRPLDRYAYAVKSGRLLVTGEYSLTQDGVRKGHRGPGQHVGDAEGWLYPLQP